jgi:hypothetical protein
MAKRYFVNVTMEIFVPEQGCGEQSTIFRLFGWVIV